MSSEHRGVRPFEGAWPTLGPGAFIAPSAQVIGRVSLGESASVWYQSVLRGDSLPISVGARTNIQDLSVLHVTGPDLPCVIGEDVTVGHRAIIHGCTVHDRCLIGMGAILLDGCVIEPECLIGAGALIPPGKRIASRSVVMGAPGKIVRKLSDEEVAHILRSAAHYVDMAQRHARSAL